MSGGGGYNPGGVTSLGTIWAADATPASPDAGDLVFATLPADSSTFGRTSGLDVAVDPEVEQLILEASNQVSLELGGRTWAIPVSGSFLATARINVNHQEMDEFFNCGFCIISDASTAIAGAFHTWRADVALYEAVGANWSSPTAFVEPFLPRTSQSPFSGYMRFAINDTASTVSALFSADGVVWVSIMTNVAYATFNAPWVPDRIGICASNRTTGQLEVATPAIRFASWDESDDGKLANHGNLVTLVAP